ncbi:MAG: LON peptidase substrate-binding domain-containing protein [Planctomycetota bacterium]
MPKSIVVDFSRPIPLFPLGGTLLLPHAVQGLHVFEPRYRQMVEACLSEVRDGDLLTARPIAMATVEPTNLRRLGAPVPLRPAVCVGQIVRHERLADGRHMLVLHGVCRARIERIEEADDQRLFRQATLAPIDPPGRVPPVMREARRAIKQLLLRPRVQRLASAKVVTQWAERDDLPGHAMVELVGSALIQDERVRYAMLDCADPWERARMVAQQIVHLEAMVAGAESQKPQAWPKGLSWN